MGTLLPHLLNAGIVLKATIHSLKTKPNKPKLQLTKSSQRDLQLLFTATGPDDQPFNFAVSDEGPLDVCLIINYYIIVHYF